jgi:hypothetical protein
MATQTQHAPGTFCWVELASTDLEAAKKFYGGLFGWTFKDTDMGPDGVYTIFQLDGRDAAALYALKKEQLDSGMPPCWSCYVAVENADETAKQAKAAGATVIVEPFDVMEHGRMAVLQDPTGAVFCLWQAKSHIGVTVLDEPGAMDWTELSTPDAAKAEKFYTAILPWKASKMPGPMDYTVFERGAAKAAGMMQITPEMKAGGVPPNWMPYFQVADCRASVAKATGLGGGTIVPANEIPGVGWFAILRDPQGAVFALHQPQMA